MLLRLLLFRCFVVVIVVRSSLPSSSSSVTRGTAGERGYREKGDSGRKGIAGVKVADGVENCGRGKGWKGKSELRSRGGRGEDNLYFLSS